MDYFIKAVQRDIQPYYEYWQPIRSGQHMPNRAAYILYQKVLFEGRTLHIAIASWLTYPSFSCFQNMLTVEGLEAASYDLYDVYSDQHPDFSFKISHIVNTHIVIT